jgi:hypothetical protein
LGELALEWRMGSLSPLAHSRVRIKFLIGKSHKSFDKGTFFTFRTITH